MTTTHVSTLFTAGESAPDAVAAFHGEDIINDAGRLSIKIIKSPGRVELDTTTEPPTLRLLGAMCLVDEGELVDGAFAHPRAVHPKDLRIANGSYQGAGSVIELR